MWFVTKPLLITDNRADNNHRGHEGNVIPRRVVIHSTAGTNSVDWLSRTSFPPVSVHRLIDRDGRIYKQAEDWEETFHVGFAPLFPYHLHVLRNANLTSLGIELENTNDGTQIYTTPQLESASKQIVEWYGAFGYLPVVGHSDLDARKSDPANFPWNELMVLVWNSVAGLANDNHAHT